MAEIIVANPDVSAPQIDGFSYEPGYWAMRAHYHTNCALTMTGKPFGDAYEPEIDEAQKCLIMTVSPAWLAQTDAKDDQDERKANTK